MASGCEFSTMCTDDDCLALNQATVGDLPICAHLRLARLCFVHGSQVGIRLYGASLMKYRRVSPPFVQA